MENSTMKEVLAEIESQSEFRIMYSGKFVDVDREVSLDVKDQKIESVLNTLFAGTDVSYTVKDRFIVLVTPELMYEGTLAVMQQQAVSGKVTDSGGLPLPGVTVVVKGTTQGTVTNADGEYRLSDIPDDATLVFSFVGMRAEEVVVGDQTTINIVMEQETIGIEEVVAIGYGTVKKSDLTGSVANVEGELISNRNSIQASEALQGAMPGVTVTRGSGSAPGSSATIRIRGITTLSNNDPLVLVDGVPVSSIDDVNANDIESISVLKDAASASIYGSRAAAGVILITTKRADSGQAVFEYSAQYGIEKPTELPEYVDAVRYMEMLNELQWNDNNNEGSEYQIFSQEHIANYLSNNQTNPDVYPITSWPDLILKDNSMRETHELSFSMGTDKLKTSGSFKYENSDALWNNKEFRRYTARINNDLDINKYLSAQIDVSLRRTINERPNINPMRNTKSSAPIYAAKWSDGRVASGKQGDNPWGRIEFGGFNNNWVNQMTGKIGIDFKPLDGLKVSAILSPVFTSGKTKTFEKAIPTYSAEDPTVFDTYLENSNSTNLFENRSESYNITGQLLTNYIKRLGAHNFNLLAGYEEFYYFSENMGGSRINYELVDFPYLDLGPLEGRENYGGALENAYRSYFGRIMYDYQSKYFLQANIRYDASSRFASEYRWGAFPSFSLGWVISEESFLQDNSWLSFLKLRGSWGRLGNERIGNYPYQSTIAFNDAAFYRGGNVTSLTTAAQVAYAIRDISWETTETYDIGIDAFFLDNKLTFTADYYQKKTKDMLLPLEIPDFIGYDNPDQNTGSMETKGWEFQVGWRDRVGEIGYSVSANISDYKSIMGDLGGTEFLGNKIKTEGSEFDEWYGYLSDGLYQSQDEIENSATLTSSVKPGDIKYIDISGPDGEPDGIISPEYDRTLLGGSLPRFVYGGNIQLDYNNFDFSVVFQGVGKQLAHLSPDMIRPLANSSQNAPALLEGNYWSVYNTDEQNQNVKYPRLSEISANGNNYVLSDYWLFNGAYFRLKNISLGYNLPENVISKVNLQGIRIYGTISDLFSLDNYPKGWDPETAALVYPVTSSYILGVSVKF
jgi:TonB-linked SusC/RagA family outer membrane protein